MKKTTVALAGIGGYGRTYAEFLLNNPYHRDFDFVGVIDPYAEQSGYLPVLKERGIPVFADMAGFYRERSADLMIVSTPIPFHREHTETALKNGSTVLCEKPTAATLADALTMRELSRKYGREVFIGFQLSFSRPIVRLKQDILAGKFGRPLYAKTLTLWERDLNYYHRGTGWAGKLRSADGSFIRDSVASNATAHYLHNLLFLLGDSMETAAMPAEVSAECRRANPIETFDTCRIRLRTVGGQRIYFAASHATLGNSEPRFELTFENASVTFDLNHGGSLTALGKDGSRLEYGLPAGPEENHQKALQVIDWLSDSGSPKPYCTVETTLPFCSVIERIFDEQDFRSFPEQDIVFDEARQRYYVKGLFEEMTRSYEKASAGEDDSE